MAFSFCFGKGSGWNLQGIHGAAERAFTCCTARAAGATPNHHWNWRSRRIKDIKNIQKPLLYLFIVEGFGWLCPSTAILMATDIFRTLAGVPLSQWHDQMNINDHQWTSLIHRVKQKQTNDQHRCALQMATLRHKNRVCDLCNWWLNRQLLYLESDCPLIFVQEGQGKSRQNICCRACTSKFPFVRVCVMICGLLPVFGNPYERICVQYSWAHDCMGGCHGHSWWLPLRLGLVIKRSQWPRLGRSVEFDGGWRWVDAHHLPHTFDFRDYHQLSASVMQVSCKCH